VPGPQTSVVVPTHRRPEQLARCLAALAAQLPPPGGFEVVVVADGEPAPPAAVPPGLDVRLLHQPQAGPAAARNRGARAARGRLLAFTDDDCRPRPDWLNALVARLHDRPDALVGGRVVNAVAGSLPAAAAQLTVDAVYAHSAGGPGAFFTTNNAGMAADAFAALGGFDVRFPLAAAEDRDLGDRARAAGHPLVFAPEAVVEHHHALTLRRFARQQHAYGRGAATFERARAARGLRREGVAPGFYAQLARRALRERPPARALGLLALVGLGQTAYVAGYLRERGSSTGPRTTSPLAWPR